MRKPERLHFYNRGLLPTANVLMRNRHPKWCYFHISTNKAYGFFTLHSSLKLLSVKVQVSLLRVLSYFAVFKV